MARYTVYLLRSAVGRLENLGVHVRGLSRNLKGTGFDSVSTNKIGVQILALSAPPVSQTALQLGLCECVADTKSLPISNMSKTAAAARRGGAAWRVTSIRHTTSRLRFAIAAVCGGGVRRWCAAAVACGSAARLQKITTLRNCPD